MRREELSSAEGSSVPGIPVPGAHGRAASSSVAPGKAGQTAQSDFHLKAPTLSLPKGGGAIQSIGEKFSANSVTGTGSLSVPIATSPGRAGFAPQLALIYDSGAGNGPCGLGHAISGLASIVRKTDKGIPRYLDSIDSDTFIIAGAEDLVPALDPDGHQRTSENLTVYGQDFLVRQYRPRIEGLFARIECWRAKDDPAHVFWRTISPDNVTSWFGRTADSRVLDPDNPTRIFQWMLCETYDDKGNVAVYHYKPEDGAGVDRSQCFETNRPARTGRHAATYLSRITYGNRHPFMPTLAEGGNGWVSPPASPDAWMLEVLFDYGEYPKLNRSRQPHPVPTAEWTVRADPFSTCRAGFEIRTWRLCHRVFMLHRFPDEEGNTRELLVKSTDFLYDVPAAMSDPRVPGYTQLREVSHRSYQRRPSSQQPAGDYEWRELPPVSFKYSQPRVDPTVHYIAAQDLPNLPVGVQGPGYQWVDLDSEGLSGVLSAHSGALHYAPNRGSGRFGPSRVVRRVPATADLASGQLQLMDLAGDGEIDLVDFSGPTPGFHERDREEGWRRHVPFASLPNIDWQDPNLRFVSLTGDGRADALIIGDEILTWYPSLGERGFGAAQQLRLSHDDDVAPRLLFNDSTQAIFLAPMNGDGNSAVVRARYGEVCYWPNEGYGRFGRKVTMANPPRFDAPDHFDPRRIRLADIDGTGTTDFIYLGRHGAQLCFNRSGNSFSNPLTVPLPMATENLGAVQVADLLGTGTACLVWNSHLPADATHPVRYVNLMADGKPHLLTAIDNNLGLTTTIKYTPSTEFYLKDLADGTPWVTHLPFVVHCVSKQTQHDKWRNTTFSTVYSYHHAHFDGVEREFRGFGKFKRLDTVAIRDVLLANTGSAYVTQDRTLHQPPVMTVTWNHTGAAEDWQRILGAFEHEYFTARHADLFVRSGFSEPVLPQPAIDPGGTSPLGADEWREALRACKGLPLREEVYELDARALEEGGQQVPVRLFSTAQHSYHIRRVQPRANQQHAVFLALGSESYTCHYELDLSAPPAQLPDLIDPRVTHNLNLRFDDFGRVEQAVSVVYPRHRPYSDSRQTPETQDLIRAVQAERHIGYVETRFTRQLNAVHARRHHRLPLPSEVLTYELTGEDSGRGFAPSRGRYFSLEDFRKFKLSDGATQGKAVVTLAYHKQPQSQAAHKRLVEHLRTHYWDDASADAPPSVQLPFGQHGPRGLKHQDYKLALTGDLLSAVFGAGTAGTPPADRLAWTVEGNRTCRALLDTAAISGYVRGADIGMPNDQYWVRSGIAGFAPSAHEHFYLPQRFTDAFGQTTTLQYDSLDWYVASSTDAKGNVSSVEAFDFRVLAPTRLIDINQNAAEVVFDIHGLPMAAATLGKVRLDPNGRRLGTESGNRLDKFGFDQLNPQPKQVAAFFGDASNPTPFDHARAREWLGKASARFVYHFGEARNAQGLVSQWAASPAGACGITRERHEGDLPNDNPALGKQGIPIQVAFDYSDGAGQTFVQNMQAEPELQGGPLRWLTNGLTVLNNKGKPVLQYEPYFSSHGHHFAHPETHGVSPVMHYDAPGRLVRTDMPDGTLNRVVMSPWHSETWDACDTVLESDWRSSRTGLNASRALSLTREGLVDANPDQRSAWLAARHAQTPAQVHFDSLGREVVSIAHNRVQDANGPHRFGGENWRDDFHMTFTKLDAEAKPLWIRDARGNLVMQYITSPKPTQWVDEPHELSPAHSAPCYDIAGNLLHQHSMDAGDRWMIHDAAGQPLLAWDFNERQDDAGQWFEEHRLYLTDYDALRRPTAQWLRVWQRPKPARMAAATAFQARPRVMLERLQYQDGATADLNNLNGQLLRHHDSSGLVQTVQRSFTGQLQEVRRQLALHPDVAQIDWQAPLAANDSRLESDVYIHITEHDALGRMVRLFNWHRAGSPVAVYEPRYNARGLMQSETLRMRAVKTVDGYARNSGRAADAVTELRYNARGQKTWLALGNGTITQYVYDPLNFRLARLYTRRDATYTSDCENPNPPPQTTAAPESPPAGRRCGVQNLHYFYDPVGNITHIRDQAQQTIWFRNSKVEPSTDYTYDALYRLTEATGREQAGNAAPPRIPEGPWPQGPVPTNTTLRRYTQRYEYDAVGNFVVFRHIAHEPGGRGSWVRHYRTAADSNRLLQTRLGNGNWAVPDPNHDTHFGYDPHGSMLNLGAQPAEFNLHWDRRDMICHIHLGGGGEVWYQYGSDKQRSRKFIRRKDNGNNSVTEERLYLGGLERYRRRLANTVVEEIESHHLFVGGQRVLLVDDVLLANDQPGPSEITLVERTCWRYQYSNHQGSVCMELDEVGRVISSGETHPYGTSSHRLMSAQVEVRAPSRRYSYTGMETDEETALSYNRARFYALQFGRWTSADPISIRGGLNVFKYADDAPSMKTDKSGTQSTWNKDDEDPDKNSLIAPFRKFFRLRSAEEKLLSGDEYKIVEGGQERPPGVAAAGEFLETTGELIDMAVPGPDPIPDPVSTKLIDTVFKLYEGAKGVVKRLAGAVSDAVSSVGSSTKRLIGDAAKALLTGPEKRLAIQGAAQGLDLVVKANKDLGLPIRSVDDVLRIAAENGIEFSEDVRIVVTEGLHSETGGAWATYGPSNKSSPHVYWDSRQNPGSSLVTYPRGSEDGSILIRIDPSVLESDELIVGVMAHEKYELGQLQNEMFDPKSGFDRAMPATEFVKRVVDGKKNLHDAAWDYATLAIENMRSRFTPARQ